MIEKGPWCLWIFTALDEAGRTCPFFSGAFLWGEWWVVHTVCVFLLLHGNLMARKISEIFFTFGLMPKRRKMAQHHTLLLAVLECP